MQTDTYNIYARTFARVASGARITDADFGGSRIRRLLWPFDMTGQVAVALAVQDVNQDSKLKSKAEFKAELRRLLASE